MHSGTLVNRPAGLIISSLGSFAFLVLNRISDIGYKGRIHLLPSKTSKTPTHLNQKPKVLPLIIIYSPTDISPTPPHLSSDPHN